MLKLAVLGSMMLLLPAAANAQSGDQLFPADRGLLFRGDVAGTRPQPDFARAGVALGAVQAFPAITVAGASDSNIFNLPGGEGDVFSVVSPDLRLLRDWGRGSVGINAEARLTRFADLTEQNSNEYGADALVQAEASAGTLTFGELGYHRTVEPRGAFGLILRGGKPSFYRELRGGLGVARDVGRLRVRLRAAGVRRRYEDLTFADGSITDARFRNIRIFSVSPRVEYGFSSDAGVFVGGTYADYKSIDPQPCCRRDAQGGLVTAGMRGSFHDIVVGEAAVGWRTQHFDLARYRDYSGLAVYAKVDWYPTTLLSLRLTVDQDFENSGLAEVAGILARQARLAAYYEAFRNVAVKASLGYLQERYREIGLRTSTRTAQLEASWSVGRVLTIALAQSLRRRSTSDGTRIPRYRGAQTMLSLTAGL